jgi:hypothetical protein
MDKSNATTRLLLTVGFGDFIVVIDFFIWLLRLFVVLDFHVRFEISQLFAFQHHPAETDFSR